MRTRNPQDHSEALAAGYVGIGAAALASGVSAKMLRHYEEIGLVPPPGRTAAGYRVYRPQDIHTLRFVKRARDLGFTMPEIKNLLALWNDRRRASADVKRLATRHAAELERKIAELDAMRRTLLELAQRCHGDHRPDCPILDDLAGPEAT
jgi:Cu(I)-responsive transcriptional regulator